MIPVSIIVSLELVKYGQSIMIEFDETMIPGREMFP